MPDAPDGVKLMSLVEIVSSEAVAPITTTETLVYKFDTYSGVSQAYQEIVTHTVTEGTIMVLQAVEFDSDYFSKTMWKLEIAGETIFEDKVFERPYSPEIPELKLAAGAIVTVSAKSSDGSTITAYADIIGKEIG